MIPVKLVDCLHLLGVELEIKHLPRQRICEAHVMKSCNKTDITHSKGLQAFRFLLYLDLKISIFTLHFFTRREAKEEEPLNHQ